MTCERVTIPLTPSSNSIMTKAASSVPMSTSSYAPPAWPAKVAPWAAKRLRCGSTVASSAFTRTILLPVMNCTVSNQWEPTSATVREGPPTAGSQRQL